jgi:hypothetical protein
MFPWAWGSFSVLGHGGFIESLSPQCQHVVESCQRLQAHRGRLRAVAASSEAAYLSSSNVPEIYERLIQELLLNRPGTDVGVLDVMIAALEGGGSFGGGSVGTAKAVLTTPSVPVTADNDSSSCAAATTRNEAAAAIDEGASISQPSQLENDQ